jgi:hypothetical protein
MPITDRLLYRLSYRGEKIGAVIKLYSPGSHASLARLGGPRCTLDLPGAYLEHVVMPPLKPIAVERDGSIVASVDKPHG